MSSKVIYNGVNIVNEVNIKSVLIDDDCGEKLDSLKVTFNDAQSLWTKYKPHQNDTIEVKQDGYSTGTMYIDNINPVDSTMVLQALPIKSKAKTKKSGAWENITLPVLCSQKAYENGLEFSGISVDVYICPRVDQQNVSDLKFISQRCNLEGALMKIHNNKMTVYNQKEFEQAEAVKVISADYMRNKNFKYNNKNCCSSYTLSCGNLSVTAIDENAVDCKGITRQDIQFYSIAEGERFAKNLLYNQNKNAVSGSFETDLDMTLAAGNVIEVTDKGMFDGKYFINHVTHMPIDNVSVFEVRRVNL